MIQTKELVSAFIYAKEGWAVRDQFDATFSNTSDDAFDEQNPTALSIIEERCSKLLKSGLLCSESETDLEEYVYALRLHLERR